MGIFDVKARTWQAPSREEQAHKAELHRLEDSEHRKHREMQHELDTLRKVEHLQHESAEDARELLQASARDSQRRRAISGLNDRDALLLLEREREAARMRTSVAHPHALHSPAATLLASPAMSSLGVGHAHPVAGGVPRISVPSSPSALGVGLSPNMLGTPRVRAVSTHHAPGMPYGASPALGLASPAMSAFPSSPMLGAGLGAPISRARSLSSASHASPATIERLRLEERKRALLEKEARMQLEREQRLRHRSSQLNLDAQELALRKRAQELDERAKLDANARRLDNQEALLSQKRREQLAEAEMEERLRALSVNTPSLNPLHASPRLGASGHQRHLSSPMAIAVDGGRSPYLSASHSPMLNTGGLDAGLLGPGAYAPGGHTRSRFIGHSPMLGTHALDGNMALDAARLGILPSGLGVDGHAHGLGGYDDRAAAYARAGVSPRIGGFDMPHGGTAGYGGYGGYNTMDGAGDFDLGLDSLGLGGGARSRRGSLSGAGLGGGVMGGPMGYDGAGGFEDPMLGRTRRDSLPFDY